MQRHEPGLQLNKKQTTLLFYLSLAMMAMFFFLFLGQPDYYIIDDSLTYMDFASDIEGAMPLYPFFLLINQIVFGEESYLYAVIMEQSVFAAFCVIQFIRFIKNHLQLGYPETYVCFMLALLPFTADLPEVVITHEILTEGIAYAAFYLFSTVLLKAVWNKSWKWYVLLCVVTLLMSSIRSQMQILFGVCGVVFIYIMVSGRKDKGKRQIPIRLLIGVIGCLATGVIGIRMTSQIAGGYQQMMKEIRAQRAEEAREKTKQDKNRDENKDTSEKTTDEQNAEADVQEDTADQTSAPVVLSGQYVSLIFNKGMYEADYEDYQLFEDERLQNLYLDLYARIDEKHCRYVYAESGLWMWRDMASSGMIGSMGIGISHKDRVEIGLTLIKAHWLRFLYHTLMLMPQAFVSTVFFQIERIYLLCHLITLFLYVSAVALMIWAYADKKTERAYGELMSSVLVTNCILVAVISVVFFGQKRYLFYNFGIFYIAYFLLLLQLWKQYGRDFVMKRVKKFRKTESDKIEDIERQCHEG